MKNKKVLITGGSRGVGKDLAQKISKNNEIIILSRTKPEFIDKNNHITHIKLDLNNPKEISGIVKNNKSLFNDIDLLINNAAVLYSSPLVLMSDEQILQQINVNFSSHLLLCKIVSRGMMRKKNGHIINVSSMATQVKAKGDSVYAATKSAMDIFAQILNNELNSYNIRVNNIAISATKTGMLSNLTAGDPEKILKYIPHNSFSTSNDIIEIIEFLVDSNTNQIGGQTIYLGGV